MKKKDESMEKMINDLRKRGQLKDRGRGVKVKVKELPVVFGSWGDVYGEVAKGGDELMNKWKEEGGMKVLIKEFVDGELEDVEYRFGYDFVRGKCFDELMELMFDKNDISAMIWNNNGEREGLCNKISMLADYLTKVKKV